MSGGNHGGGGWGSRFLKVAGAAAVAGGLYAILSKASASSQQEVPFGAQLESNESDGGGPTRRPHGGATTLVRWKKPEIGWVKLNVDGSGVDDSHVDGSRDPYKSSSAGCGGVIRDARGTWLMGFAKKLDPTFRPHETELQAILTGLELASEMNMEKLVVESDSEPAVSMVKSGLGYKYQRPEYDVVQDIVRLLSDPKWQARLDCVPRTANRVANRLAKHARKQLSSHGLRKYHHPPESDDVDDCARLFLEDNGQGV